MDNKRTIGQRWEAYRPTKGLAVWAFLVGAVGATVVGFSWGGWVTRWLPRWVCPWPDPSPAWHHLTGRGHSPLIQVGRGAPAFRPLQQPCPMPSAALGLCLSGSWL